MFNFTTVVFDGTSPTFYFTNTSGWNTSSSNVWTLRMAQHSQTLRASAQSSRSTPLHDAHQNCRRKKRQTGTDMSNRVTVLLSNDHNATYVTQKLTMSTTFNSELLLPTVTSTVTVLREFVRLTCHKRTAY